jgi:hypothetical protein
LKKAARLGRPGGNPASGKEEALAVSERSRAMAEGTVIALALLAAILLIARLTE